MATTLLYDSDCRFCRATLGLLLAWDRQRKLRPVALQSEEGARLLPGLTSEQRLEAARAVPESGIPHTAGAAAPVVLRELPGGARARGAGRAGAGRDRAGLRAGGRQPQHALAARAGRAVRRADALIARRLRNLTRNPQRGEDRLGFVKGAS